MSTAEKVDKASFALMQSLVGEDVARVVDMRMSLEDMEMV